MSTKRNPGPALLALTAAFLALTGGIPAAGYALAPQAVEAAPPQTHLTPTPTLVRTPTRTPPPTPRPTSASAQVFNLEEIEYITGIGGGGPECGVWEDIQDELPANARLPYVDAENFYMDTRFVCAYGFPPEQEVTLELYTPDGRKAAAYPYSDAETTDALDGRIAYLDLPYGLPYGEWTIVLRGGRLTARNTFTHPARYRAMLDVNHILSADTLNPDDPRWRMGFKPGDRAAMYGVGFPPSSEISVAVGTIEDDILHPAAGWTVRTDRGGDFYIQFTIDRAFKDGRYGISVNETTGRSLDEEAWHNDPAQLTYFTVNIPWRACRSGPLSNLEVGDWAQLSPGPPNNVRNRPRLDANKIGQIQPYQSVYIEDGPKCNDGFTWWYVQVWDFDAENHGLKGWTAEGSASGYWLVPSH